MNCSKNELTDYKIGGDPAYLHPNVSDKHPKTIHSTPISVRIMGGDSSNKFLTHDLFITVISHVQ